MARGVNAGALGGYEAWCSQRPGDIIVMIEEVHGRRVRAGESFSATHVVGYFDDIEEMHASMSDTRATPGCARRSRAGG